MKDKCRPAPGSNQINMTTEEELEQKVKELEGDITKSVAVFVELDKVFGLTELVNGKSSNMMLMAARLLPKITKYTNDLESGKAEINVFTDAAYLIEKYQQEK